MNWLRCLKLRLDLYWTAMCIEYNIAEIEAHQRELEMLNRRAERIQRELMSKASARSIIGRSM